MSLKRLIEMCDKDMRESLEGYYFISKTRMDELILNFEKQAFRIRELTQIISDQQEQILNLEQELCKF